MASQPATRQENPLVQLNTQLQSRADQFRMVLPSHISVDKFQRTILTAVQNDPQLLNADRQSFLLACMKAAQDGLLPDKREAALVIFKENKQVNGQWQTRELVQYMPMVYGLRKKILQSGEISDITTNVVYRAEIESGAFYYEEGIERTLRHKPILDPDFEPKDEDIAAAYSVAIYKDGTKSFEVMRRSEINKVREKSQTGALRDRKGNPRTPSGPWVDWFSEQARKTVMRRHSKSLPMSGDLIDVEAADEIAAASAQDVLASAPQAPALGQAVVPPRLAAVDDGLTINQTLNIDADGVVVDEQPPAAVKPKRQKQQEQAPPPPPADDPGPQPDDRQKPGDEPAQQQEQGAAPPADEFDADAAYDSFSGRIKNASTVGSLNRVVGDINASPLQDSWKQTLLDQAEAKRAQLAGGQANG